MNTGIFGEGFPYSNFHDLNMDWIIKIAKDFLDQYTHIQEIIANGEESLTTIITEGEDSLATQIAEGLENLDAKEEVLITALQDWYDLHSDEIAEQLATSLTTLSNQLDTSLTTLNNQLTHNTSVFSETAENIGQSVIASIPADYTAMAETVQEIYNHFYSLINTRNLFSKRDATLDNYYYADGATPTLVSNSSYCCYLAEIYDDTKLYTVNYKDYGMSAYDASKNFIANVNFVAGTPHNVPAGTKYIIVSCLKTHMDEMMLVEGDLPSVYIPFGITLHKADYLHDSQIENRNLFDKDNVIMNSYYQGDNLTPTLVTNANFCCYLAEIFDDEALYTVTSRDYQSDAFDENKNLIRQVNFVANIPHDVPKGTKYISISVQNSHRDTFMLVKGHLPTSYVKYGAKFKNETEEEIYHVGANQPYRYLIPLLKSLAGNRHKKTIYIHHGAYNIFEEYGGSAYMQTLTGNEDWKSVSVFVPANTSIIGIGDVTLEFAPSAEDIISDNIARLFSVLNLDETCHIENLYLRAKNCRYCIHDEDITHDRTIIHTFKNVRANKVQGDYGDYQAYGGGYATSRRYDFEGCEFNSYSIPWSIHNGDLDDSSTYRGTMINISNSIFTTSIANVVLSFRQNSNVQIHDKVLITNCHLGGYQKIQITDSGYANRPNGFLIKTIGCNSFNPDYSLIEPNVYPIEQYNALS